MIRRVTSDDWRLWRSLRRRALAEDPGAFAASTAAWSGADDVEERWRGRIEAARACFVAEVRGDAVGMVAADEAPDGQGLVLASMWVAPEARGRGVGAALTQAVVDLAGSTPLHLRVMADNETAIAAYRSSGFDLDPGPRDAEGCRTMRRRPTVSTPDPL